MKIDFSYFGVFKFHFVKIIVRLCHVIHVIVRLGFVYCVTVVANSCFSSVFAALDQGYTYPWLDCIAGLPHPGKVLESPGFFLLSWKVLESP